MSAELLFAYYPELRDAVPPQPIPRLPIKGRSTSSFKVADEWSQLVQRVERGEYRLRAPATSTAGLCGPFRSVGTCLKPVRMHGDVFWIDPTLPAEDGDFVTVQWHPDTLQKIIERCRDKPEWLAMYGPNPGDIAGKWLRRFGNSYWLVTNTTMLPLGGSPYFGGENRILGVVRYVERNGRPLYGSGEPIPVSHINHNAATKMFVGLRPGPATLNSGASGNVHEITVPAQESDYTAIVTTTGDFAEGGSPAATQPVLDSNQTTTTGTQGTLAGNSVLVQNITNTPNADFERLTVQGQFACVADQTYYFGTWWTNDDSTNNPINLQNVQTQVVVVFR